MERRSPRTRGWSWTCGRLWHGLTSGAFLYYRRTMASTTFPEPLASRIRATGPACLHLLVVSAGGLRGAARHAGVSTGTLDRWLIEPEGDEDWAGYPNPLPAFDRVVGRISDLSFLGNMASHHGMPETLRWARSRGLALSDAGWPEAVLLLAGRAARIPRTSLRRMLDGVPWPSSLHALDALAEVTEKMGWFEFVLAQDPRRMRRPVPVPALVCLLQSPEEIPVGKGEREIVE